jgi:hypothetical protein
MQNIDPGISAAYAAVGWFIFDLYNKIEAKNQQGAVKQGIFGLIFVIGCMAQKYDPILGINTVWGYIVSGLVMAAIGTGIYHVADMVKSAKDAQTAVVELNASEPCPSPSPADLLGLKSVDKENTPTEVK